MEQQLDLDLPKKLGECQENVEEYVKKVKENAEIVLEEAKYSGAPKLIASAQAFYDNVMDSLVPSHEETAKNYEQAKEEAQRLLSALGM